MASKFIIDLVKRYIHLLNQEGFGINRAFIYGSYASGKNHENSDIDLMLISNMLDEFDVQKKSKAWVLTQNVDRRIEPYLVSQKRFNIDDGSPLLEIVRKEGIEVAF
jgi:predicted nucleotidyltransferase